MDSNNESRHRSQSSSDVAEKNSFAVVIEDSEESLLIPSSADPTEENNTKDLAIDVHVTDDSENKNIPAGGAAKEESLQYSSFCSGTATARGRKNVTSPATKNEHEDGTSGDGEILAKLMEENRLLRKKLSRLQEERYGATGGGADGSDGGVDRERTKGILGTVKQHITTATEEAAAKLSNGGRQSRAKLGRKGSKYERVECSESGIHGEGEISSATHDDDDVSKNGSCKNGPLAGAITEEESHRKAALFDISDGRDVHSVSSNGGSESSSFGFIDDNEFVDDDMNDPLHEGPFREVLCDRASWLVGLLVLQSFSSFILERNEALLQRHLVIVHFLTMLVGAGGNAGNQACVRVIRGLAVGSLNDETLKGFLFQEFKMAMLLSIILAISGFIRAAVFRTPLGELIAITMSLFMIVITSIFIGALLPLLMKLVGIDPAHSCTTIQVMMDIIGVLLTVHVSSAILNTSWGIEHSSPPLDSGVYGE